MVRGQVRKNCLARMACLIRARCTPCCCDPNGISPMIGVSWVFHKVERVGSRPRFSAVVVCQRELPNGRPRCTEVCTASNSAFARLMTCDTIPPGAMRAIRGVPQIYPPACQSLDLSPFLPPLSHRSRFLSVRVSPARHCWYSGGTSIVTGDCKCKGECLGQDCAAGAGIHSGSGSSLSEDCRAFGAKA